MEYYYNRSIKTGITYNYVEFLEENFTSPVLTKMIGILGIHLSDNDVMEYLYTLNKVNISETRIFNVRQELSNKANIWSDKILPNKIDELIVKNNFTERMAIELDEGKVHIRSKEKNSVTDEYEYFWKNVKLVLTYPFDEEGKKNGKTIYLAEIDKELKEFCDCEFKNLLHISEYNKASIKAALSDGASGYNELFQKYCPDSFLILDAMHLKEHIWVLAKLLYPDENAKPSLNAKKFVNFHYDNLKEKGAENFIVSLNLDRPKGKGSRKVNKIWDKEINYFTKNKNRLDYPEYILNNLPLGSGVVEGAIKYVCNKRLKNGSPIWLLDNINGLLKLRVFWFNDYFEDFWGWRKSILKENWLMGA